MNNNLNQASVKIAGKSYIINGPFSITKTKYQYDEKGRETLNTLLKDGKIFTTVNEYSGNNLIKMVTDIKDQAVTTNKIRPKKVESENSSTSTFEYDNKNRLIKQTSPGYSYEAKYSNGRLYSTAIKDGVVVESVVNSTTSALIRKKITTQGTNKLLYNYSLVHRKDNITVETEIDNNTSGNGDHQYSKVVKLYKNWERETTSLCDGTTAIFKVTSQNGDFISSHESVISDCKYDSKDRIISYLETAKDIVGNAKPSITKNTYEYKYNKYNYNTEIRRNGVKVMSLEDAKLSRLEEKHKPITKCPTVVNVSYDPNTGKPTDVNITEEFDDKHSDMQIDITKSTTDFNQVSVNYTMDDFEYIFQSSIRSLVTVEIMKLKTDEHDISIIRAAKSKVLNNPKMKGLFGGKLEGDSTVSITYTDNSSTGKPLVEYKIYTSADLGIFDRIKTDMLKNEVARKHYDHIKEYLAVADRFLK